MNALLYNGIVLPETWPPRDVDEGGTAPVPVPYLDDPPEVICIDLGRQLFVDDFLIASTSLTRVFGEAKIHEASPVLSPETDEEMDNGYCPMAAPFNDGAWYDPEDGLFKLWYMPGWFHSTALAISRDGIHWERPDLNVVRGTNLVWPNRDRYDRDGCLVWLDHDAERPEERFKMFQYYRYDTRGNATVSEGWLHTSPDGIHWSDPVVTTPVGDNTSFFYNPFRKKWCMSIRRQSANLRARFYRECDDFLPTWDRDRNEVLWQRIDSLALPDPALPDHRVALYDVNATPYESLMLGMFAIFRGPENDICAEKGVPKTMDLELGYSRDGFHFSRPNRTPFLASSRRIGDWNRAYLHAVGGVCMVVGDEVWIYFTGFSGQSPKLGKTDAGAIGRSRRVMYAGASTGLATIRRDGFASMDAGTEGGVLTTRPVVFKGHRLFVNAEVPKGELRVEVLEENGRPVESLSADQCVPLCVDRTCCEVLWTSGKNLSSIVGRPVVFRFYLRSGRLFSFWVTDDPNGASSGYMAAGGPGCINGRDLPG
ncbi:MAG: glycosyl hydrolase family 32 [Gemmatimonadetes bacterium]|nr:glycosyl hydrolase family 32 [Gemmatimonadota bacterium]